MKPLKEWDEEPLRPLVEHVLSEVSPERLIERAISRVGSDLLFNAVAIKGWEPSLRTNIEGTKPHVISLGKAAAPMMKGAVDRLRELGLEAASDPICISPYEVPEKLILPGVVYLKGGHPFPDERDIRNMEKVMEALSSLTERDLVMFLISGGSSSLTLFPKEGVDWKDKTELVRELMGKGADIQELNIVRRTLSRSKGGGLARAAGDSRKVALVISDVMGDDPRFIGSGPTFNWAPPKGGFSRILEKYDIPKGKYWGLESAAMVSEVGHHRRSSGPPAHNLLIGNNDTVLEALSRRFCLNGVTVHLERSKFSGEARVIGQTLLDSARIICRSKGLSHFLQGGESTSKVMGSGKGGRSSEMALSLLGALGSSESVMCLSTDGVDGSWDGAGAVIRMTGITQDVISDHLKRSDSGSFFDTFGGKIATGPTLNNMGDVFLFSNLPS